MYSCNFLTHFKQHHTHPHEIESPDSEHPAVAPPPITEADWLASTKPTDKTPSVLPAGVGARNPAPSTLLSSFWTLSLDGDTGERLAEGVERKRKLSVSHVNPYSPTDVTSTPNIATNRKSVVRPSSQPTPSASLTAPSSSSSPSPSPPPPTITTTPPAPSEVPLSPPSMSPRGGSFPHLPPSVEVENIELDGQTLTTRTLWKLGYDMGVRLNLSETAWAQLKRARDVVEKILDERQTVYGINTGFGSFSNVVVSEDQLSLLQENLIRSHAAGVGEPLSVPRTRMLLALRINVLAKGHSGIRPETVKALLAAFNAGCYSWVPAQGTVGASGDLAPLSHLALGYLGEGKMWNSKRGEWANAMDVLVDNGLKPISLTAKEGLALINGTQLISSIGAEATERAGLLALQADAIACLTLEALKGTRRAFLAMIHAVRPHAGQQAVAQRLRALLHTTTHPSPLYVDHHNCGRVQDSYTLRCIPQVHGISHDTILFVKSILNTELNSATDNPMVFPETDEILSAGNFHGEYPAKALDYLAIGVQELANISERRLERLINPQLSNLPAFLVKEGGLNSGFMIAHCTSAALVSENKVLCHPASIDTISTSAAKEDHVSMGGMAARKALKVVSNVETVLGIELLAAVQALDFCVDADGNPLKSTAPIEEIRRLVRSVASPWTKDRWMSPDIEAVTQLVRDGRIWAIVEPWVISQAGEEEEFVKKHGSVFTKDHSIL